ncbi:hypothetical protein F5B22DRAFT_612998 [Xylaria bambusicola]|uniref:uncharacterized protein n=1 Tax=Xylaria bambusicola TaxID=326684 RepID=UPI002008D063|nr:uncharacterized protein F5B22DRAFT_612998 [Xylaria bambusicola]KAI0513001.1 hypothetical protein F5B22DRAFT_612998 [Xylaria bambusicola]
MLLCLLFGAVTCSSLASATTVTFVSWTSTSTCSYQLESGGVPPTPVPTSEVTFYTTEITTNATLTVPPTSTVEAPRVTSTLHTLTAYTFAVPTVTVPTSTSYAQVWKTVATGTFADTVCANGANPTTVTKYTGTYTAVSGQETTVPATYPVSALCSTGTIYYNFILPTVTRGSTVTTTSTPTVYATSYTTTSTSTIIYYTVTSYLTTVSSTITSYVPHAETTTHTVACPEKTVTKTLDARCAPTNLIGTINGEGIRSGRYADRVSVIYTREEPWASDYTACCQACIDNEGCGASDSGFGACGLYYSATVEGEPICDAFILSFTSSPNAYPGQSLVYQTGCGEIEYDGSLP